MSPSQPRPRDLSNAHSVEVWQGAVDADLHYIEAAIPFPDCDTVFRTLRDEIDWQQHRITLFGRDIPCPRKSAWIGDPNAVYRYSGMQLQPAPWTWLLMNLRDRVERLAGARFNSVLLNLYRDGRDSMGWHADDEPELGECPTIASLSLGAPRRFSLRRPDNPGLRLMLAPGSLLIMAGQTQKHWQHAVPKTRKAVGERINLTFRLIRR